MLDCVALGAGDSSRNVGRVLGALRSQYVTHGISVTQRFGKRCDKNVSAGCYLRWETFQSGLVCAEKDVANSHCKERQEFGFDSTDGTEKHGRYFLQSFCTEGALL